MCRSIAAPASLVVVMGTQYFDSSGLGGEDFPVPELLQMLGLASRPLKDDSGIAVIMCHAAKKEHYKKFLFEPLPVESHLDMHLHDHMVSASAYLSSEPWGSVLTVGTHSHVLAVRGLFDPTRSRVQAWPPAPSSCRSLRIGVQRGSQRVKHLMQHVYRCTIADALEWEVQAGRVSVLLCASRHVSAETLGLLLKHGGLGGCRYPRSPWRQSTTSKKRLTG